jgi:hypothetical protein
MWQQSCHLRSVRILAATLALTALAFADPAFTDLATNRDGSVLYFSSPLRLQGSEQFPWPKIFMWSRQEGVRLYQQREAGNIVTGFGWGSIAPYRLIAPSLAENGAVAFTGVSDCTWGTPCATTVEKYRSTIRIPGKPDQFLDGSATLSPNGRYALLISSRYLGDSDLVPPMWWVDLQTNEVIKLAAGHREPPFRHRIANDGTIVASIRLDGQLTSVLWRPGSTKAIPFTYNALLINSSASKLVAQAPAGLIVYDVATAKQTLLSRSTQDVPIDISEDGSLIVALNAGRMYTIRSDGTDLRPHAVLDKIGDACLSGDGRVLFAASETSRILRIELDTGAVDEIVPPTMFSLLVDNGSSSTVGQGSLLQLTPAPSTHFPDAKPESARFRGKIWPVLSADTNEIMLQVPWTCRSKKPAVSWN